MSKYISISQKPIFRCITGLTASESCRLAFISYIFFTFPALCSYDNFNKFQHIKDKHDSNTRRGNDIATPRSEYECC